ncbi:MFS transporter [Paractinoplanes atraurantiacus]|uniref:Predicted arabinose efflux permease, MFS family n=1 Tax=Paractinoplanes atraurantiacus TaxID=1036182 RepID=A0A285K8X5_9ACTN|nr:MFS transporter [Actinoplanes atraurantiacus]SNY69040.1 Predicted arabinose efflux permease, MFS family [Actinoplanes atraurantiacus]
MSATPLPQQTVLMCALIGTAQMTWGVTVPVLPVYLDSYGIAVGLLGPLVAAFAVGRILANIPAGLALRRFPARTYLRVVLVGLALVTALTGLATSAGVLIGFRLVAGVLGGAAVTVGFALLVAGAPAGRRGAVMATATVVQMSTAGAGALLGGAVVGVVGPAWTFAVAAVPVLGVLLWDAARPASHYWSSTAASRTPPPTEPALPGGAPVGQYPGKAHDQVGRLWTTRLWGKRRTRPQPVLKRSWLLLALCAEAFATFFVRFAGEQGLVPVLAYDSGGLKPFTLGLATAAGTVASLAAMPLIARWVDRGARIALLVPAGIAGAVAMLCLPLLHVPAGFAVAIVAYSLATSVIGVLPGVITGDAYPASAAGGVIGLTRTAGDIGAAIGPLAVFAVAGFAGFEAACAVLAALFLLAAAGLVTALLRHRSSQAAIAAPALVGAP